MSDVTEPFRDALEAAGWTGPGFPWVDHRFTTDSARLDVRYLDDPPPPSLDLELQLRYGTATFTTYLALRPGDNGPAIVDAIVAAAPALDPTTWPALYDRLVTLAERVARVDGIDGRDTWIAGPGDDEKVLERIA